MRHLRSLLPGYEPRSGLGGVPRAPRCLGLVGCRAYRVLCIIDTCGINIQYIHWRLTYYSKL